MHNNFACHHLILTVKYLPELHKQLLRARNSRKGTLLSTVQCPLNRSTAQDAGALRLMLQMSLRSFGSKSNFLNLRTYILSIVSEGIFVLGPSQTSLIEALTFVQMWLRGSWVQVKLLYLNDLFYFKYFWGAYGVSQTLLMNVLQCHLACVELRLKYVRQQSSINVLLEKCCKELWLKYVL